MADQFTEVSNQSWLSRISDSFKGILLGFLMFIAGFPLLYWNEGRAVKTFKSLTEGASSVVNVAPDKVDSANNGKLVHLQGLADTQDTVMDSSFGISAKAIKLKRHVEMYQWKEKSESKTEKKMGGKEETVTTYNYEKQWDQSWIDSSKFKITQDHLNPVMNYKSDQFVAKNVTVGEFKLSPSQINSISGGEKLSLRGDHLTPALKASLSSIQLDKDGFYLGQNPATPQVGDYRITYEQVLPATISLVAKQTGQTFEPYVAKAGGTIELLQMGEHTAENMFADAQKSNAMLTWVLRFVGFLLMFLGISSIFKPLSVVADVIPLIGSLVGAGTGVVAFLIASIFASITIAIAWIASRPVLGISFLVLSAGAAVALFLVRKKKNLAPVAG